MAAVVAMQFEHPPDGGIHWLQVKPWLCFISAASAWQSKFPAFDVYFFVVVDFVVAHNHS